MPLPFQPGPNSGLDFGGQSRPQPQGLQGLDTLRPMIQQFMQGAGAQSAPDFANVGMQAPQSMNGLLGPTHRLFSGEQPGQYSTEIGMVTNHPTQQNQFTFSPMLVPGQVGVNNLLNGQPATWMQHAFAQDWARQNAQQLPQFNSVDEALAAQQWRHHQLAAALLPLLQGYIQNMPPALGMNQPNLGVTY